MLERSTHRHSRTVIDVYRLRTERPTPLVLLWHGAGEDGRSELATLAATVAEAGVVVVVPSWRSDDVEQGHADLLASVAFTRSRALALGSDPGSVTLAGWSAGGRAAAGFVINGGLVLDWAPRALVGISASYDKPTPTARTTPAGDLDTAARAVPTWLVHGSLDEVVDIEGSRRFARALGAAGWPVTLVEPTTDHAGAVLTVFSPGLGRCVPTADVPAVAESAAPSLIAAALASPGPADNTTNRA